MASIDVDVNDFYDALDHYEKDDLFELLKEDGYFEEKAENEIINTDSFDQHVLRQNFIKLMNVYNSITLEDLATITQISNKY